MMEQRLKNHIETIFHNMPQNQSAFEMKEEILQNLIDKYHDLIAEGKDEETAYSIAIASIGDINSLFTAPQVPVNAAEIQRQKNKSALLTSLAIMLYIMSVIPPILLASTPYVDTLAPVLMFVMVAVATGILIYNNKTKPSKNQTQETLVGEFRQWQEGSPSKKSKRKSIEGVLWSFTVLIYLAVSFLTFQWHITWLIFIVAVAIDQVIRLFLTIND